MPRGARRICDVLRAAGIEVWFDQSELRGGDAWDQQIRHQIRECALFVPVISAHTQARLEGYFRREWRLAVDRTHDMADGKPFLVPVVIDDTDDKDAQRPRGVSRRAVDAPASGRGYGGLCRACVAAAGARRSRVGSRPCHPVRHRARAENTNRLLPGPAHSAGGGSRC